MFKEREKMTVVGKGWQHIVYRPSESNEYMQGKLIKRPRLWGRFFYAIASEPTRQRRINALLQEDQAARDAEPITHIAVPQAEFFRSGQSYAIVVDEIIPDESVDIHRFLKENPQFVTVFDASENNFMAQNGTVYAIDHLKGVGERLLERMGLPIEKQKAIKMTIGIRSIAKKLGRPSRHSVV